MESISDELKNELSSWMYSSKTLMSVISYSEQKILINVLHNIDSMFQFCRYMDSFINILNSNVISIQHYKFNISMSSSEN